MLRVKGSDLIDLNKCLENEIDIIKKTLKVGCENKNFPCLLL